MRPIRLTSYNIAKIGIREWGLPTGRYVGKLWRSERNRTITCLLPHDADTLRAESRHVLIVDRPDEQWIPATWRRAMSAYKRQWPDSAPRLLRMPK